MPRIAHPTRAIRASLLVAIALTLVGQPAAAISLGALTAGASLASDDGALRFDDFSVSFLPGFHEDTNVLSNLDLTLVDVQLISLGDRHVLSFEGGLEVSYRSLGQMWIDYTVAAGDGFEITGADLSLKAEALATLSSASVTESIAGDAAAWLRVSERADGTGSQIDGGALALPARNLTVSNDVFMDGGFEGTTRIASLQQGFTVTGSVSPVPEPGAALLYAVGLLIAATRLRRADA